MVMPARRAFGKTAMDFPSGSPTRSRVPVVLAALAALCQGCVFAADVGPFDISEVAVTRYIGLITGEDSPNLTRSRWGLGGTDLGVLFGDGPVYMAFGDSFSSEGSFNSGWRRNLLAELEPGNPEEVPRFRRMVTGSDPAYAKELVARQPSWGTGITIVPTGGFQLGDSLYLNFMDVGKWGPAGSGTWTCNFGGLWKSDDSGDNWTALESIRWPGDSNFVQAAPLVVGDHIYFWCIPAGRRGDLFLMRVATAEVESPTAYEFYQGTDSAGTPFYAKGAAAMRSATAVASGPFSEPSVIYNPWLNSYLVMYLHDFYGIVACTAPNPEGPWSPPVLILGYGSYPALYGGFMHSSLIAEGGRRVYFALSQWLPTYNVRWMEVEFERKPRDYRLRSRWLPRLFGAYAVRR
jgi:hypothetical protein